MSDDAPDDPQNDNGDNPQGCAIAVGIVVLFFLLFVGTCAIR